MLWLALFVPMGFALPVADPLAYAYPMQMVFWIRSGGRVGHLVDGYIMSIQSDSHLDGDEGRPPESLLRYRRRADGFEDEHVLMDLVPKIDGTLLEIEKVE